MINDPARDEKVRVLMGRLDLRALLERYDLEVMDEVSSRKGGTELVCVCPFHQTISANFYFNDTNGRFLCRSIYCGVGGDVIRFVAKKENCSDSMAFEILCEAAGIDPSELDVLNLTMNMVNNIGTRPRFKGLKLEPILLPPTYKEMPHPYLVRARGLSPRVLADAKAGAVLKDVFYKYRACVPVTLDNKLYSIYSRATGSEESWLRLNPGAESKVKQFFPRHHYSGASLTSRLLYGIDDVDGDQVIIVEAIISVLKLRTLGFNNAVAMLKAGVSQEQAKLLIRKRFSRVLVCADNDLKVDEDTGKKFNPGAKAAWSIYRKLKNHFDVGILRLPINVDPADMDTRDEFEEVLATASWPQGQARCREQIETIFT